MADTTMTNPDAVPETTPFPELVRALAVEAFVGAWEPGYAVWNIRRACRLLTQAGGISADEPAVESCSKPSVRTIGRVIVGGGGK